MEPQNDPLKDPANWPPGDFLDPNPWFAAPPRPLIGARWASKVPWYVSLLLIALGVLGFAISLEYVPAANYPPGLGVYAGWVLMVLVGVGTLLEGLPHTRWRHGRIIPVEIVSRARGLPDGSGKDFLVMLILDVFCHMGFLVRLFQYLSRVGDTHPNAMTVQWLEVGKKRTATLRAGLFWNRWEVGETCWICVCPPFRIQLLEEICPEALNVADPPKEVDARLLGELKRFEAMRYTEQQEYHRHCQAERDRLLEQEADLHKAADATTRIMKRSNTYEKRPQ
ncbi:MAG: hypothetical protein H6839_07210 [Planctomycetes bacterium]|nr:hypothetical protein [Planctomycetota bacterium]